MKNAGKARSYGLYRHLRTSKEIIENLLNYFSKSPKLSIKSHKNGEIQPLQTSLKPINDNDVFFLNM